MPLTRTLARVLAVPLFVRGGEVGSWGDVRTIPSGTKVRGALPDGSRIGGRFESALEDSIVVRRNGRILRAVQRPSAVPMQVRIPPSDRRTGWIVTGVTVVGMVAWSPYAAPGTTNPYSRESRGIVPLISAATTIPVALLAFRLSGWNTVYSW